MNRVELAVASAGLTPLVQPEAASPVLTPTIFLVGVAVGAAAYGCFHIGVDSRYEAPARHDSQDRSASELLRARQQQMAA